MCSRGGDRSKEGGLVGETFKLAVVEVLQERGKMRAGFVAEGDEVASGDEGRGEDRFGGELGARCLEEIVDGEEGVRGKAIEAVQFEFIVEGGRTEEAA